MATFASFNQFYHNQLVYSNKTMGRVVIVLLMIALVQLGINAESSSSSSSSKDSEEESHEQFYLEEFDRFIKENPQFDYLTDMVKQGDKVARKTYETQSLRLQFEKTRARSGIQKDDSQREKHQIVLDFIEDYVSGGVEPKDKKRPKLRDLLKESMMKQVVKDNLNELGYLAERGACDIECFAEHLQKIVLGSLDGIDSELLDKLERSNSNSNSDSDSDSDSNSNSNSNSNSEAKSENSTNLPPSDSLKSDL